MSLNENVKVKKRIFARRKADFTSQFKKDFNKISQSGAHDMSRLRDAIKLLIDNEATISKEWCDHRLNGKWSDHRELHVKGDLLLIYRLEGDNEVIFVRVGTHSKLFGM